LEDDSFKTASPVAAEARKMALGLLEWSESLQLLILKLMMRKYVHEVLLKKIVELYITIRGFSYASGWMEKFKKVTKQSTQRSKSLRRDLHETVAST